MLKTELHLIAGLLVFLCPLAPVLAGPVVNEVMASNQTTLADSAGEFDDWVEIYNPEGSDLDLQGYFVSDDADDLEKWPIPESLIVPAGGYSILWLDDDLEQGSNHLPFRLAAEGDVFILTAPDGETVLDQVDLPVQHPDISYGRVGEEFRYLINPTPGVVNDPLGVAVLEGVTFSHDAGTFVGAFDLGLMTSSEGVTIRYTVDGTVPTSANGADYSAPVSIAENRCVRAALFLGSTQISPVETRIFLELDAGFSSFNSNLPVVLIDSQGYDFSGDEDPRTDYPAQPVCAGFFETGVNGRAEVSGDAQFVGRAGMNVRGASSKEWPKKQFKFETWDEEDGDRDVALLGMPADADWILAAPYFDKSLMRNDFVYHFWEQLGYYSPRTRFVEVFVNPSPGEAFSMDHYRGVYILTEKIKRSADRMDVTRLDPEDVSEPEITGGYIAQATNLNEDWVSGEGTRYKYVEPSKDDPLSPQKTWLRNYVEVAEDSVYAGNFADPENGYAKYLEVPSQIDYDIMRELSRNADGASTFFSIDRGGKLKMGPLWDYNQALGLTSLAASGHGNSWDTFGWNTYYMRAGHWLAWWGKLEDDPLYQRGWNDRWVSLREGALSNIELLGHIDETAALLEEAQVRNFEKWDILGEAVWTPNGRTRADPGDLDRDTYAKEVAFIRDWVDDRVQWIDSQVPSPPDFNQNGGSVPNGFALEMNSGSGFQVFAGDVFYTMDGSDPATPGAASILYDGPISLNENVQIKARTMNSSGDWGSLREEVFLIGAEPPSSANLVISEIHYNPDGSDDLEFIEIANRGVAPVNLTGVRLSSAVEFIFGEVDLLVGGVVLIVEDEVAFRSVYENVVPGTFIAGQWSGRLNNAGDTVDLIDPDDLLLHRVMYEQDGDWPSEADGKGFSLQLRELGLDPAQVENWRLSTFENGNPGALLSPDAMTFEMWQQANFSVVELAAAEVVGELADPDDDGIVNLLEFGFGSDPFERGEDPVELGFEMIEVNGVSDNFVTVTFDRPVNSELQYALQTSSDLLNWKTRPLVPVRRMIDLETMVETLTVREQNALTGGQAHFRIQVSR